MSFELSTYIYRLSCITRQFKSAGAAVVLVQFFLIQYFTHRRTVLHYIIIIIIIIKCVCYNGSICSQVNDVIAMRKLTVDIPLYVQVLLG